ncbi:Z1 domain-containing protein [Agrobacterium tumefaciens]|uniref:Z1 domain-containing protein n=1 Tax=Agrobacterium tumefaciens TaxID=358 RepID=UPI000DD4C60C|nr:Z1 domain-containing protein [Agrobacterium tumefaciens]NSZ85236.1 Z1 domain-containing protein [Agrobacterium tumefaciens]WCA70486.1 Z1 domain-containing protein [Agrobacterium tumefaciens]
MTSPQIDTFATQLRQRRANYGTLEETAAACRREMEGIFGPFSTEMVANLEAALEVVRAEMQDVEVLRRHSIVDTPEDWYRGPGANSYHWSALHEYLKTKGWHSDTIASLDRASTEVMSLLGNPAREKIACRGLVVGYVQSGKTANMTAVMAKAVDAGYNLIIVLGGVTNKLRKQTQDRFEKDVLRHRTLWQLYTTSEPNGDFVQPPNGGFVMPAEGHAQLVVMKKEGSRLKQLRRTISKTPKAVLRALKVLLIDDECDQASVNSARGEFDITKINAEIRHILAALPAVTYVGYTATPFANVFINPYPYGNEDVLDDLYPRDFITALDRPIGYFGAREVFGSDSAEADGDERDMIRILHDNDPDRLRPTSPKDKETFHPEMTESLEDATLWFLATCAIRRARGQEGEHMSMLVHSSPNVRQHEYMSELIQNWIEERKSDLISGTGESTDRLRKVFVDERERTAPVGQDRIPEDFNVVLTHLPAVLEALSYPVENGETEDAFRLDYTGDPVTCIVVGGTVLARGLTLEGLCVSFFLRTSKQYDTLLQMGRWFGYRRGYEDLPRLWTTEDLASKFRSLAVIEEEIRQDIAIYRENRLTPRDFAVKVRSIPGMAITAATKMRHALRTSMSFSGKHVQTIRFDHHDSEVLGTNWSAASQLVDAMLAERAFDEKPRGFLFREVPLKTVRRFLTATEISDEHMDLKKPHLIRYLDETDGSLGLWNVAIVQTKSDTKSAKPLGGLGNVATMRRSRLREASPRYADIKALMSKADILIDAERTPDKEDWTSYKACRPAIPLLLLYLIDAESKPLDRKSGRVEPASRVPLDAVADVVGFGIVFPGQKDRSGGYFSVDIEPPAVEETIEGQDQIEEVEGANA